MYNIVTFTLLGYLFENKLQGEMDFRFPVWQILGHEYFNVWTVHQYIRTLKYSTRFQNWKKKKKNFNYTKKNALVI